MLLSGEVSAHTAWTKDADSSSAATYAARGPCMRVHRGHPEVVRELLARQATATVSACCYGAADHGMPPPMLLVTKVGANSSSSQAMARPPSWMMMPVSQPARR